nr:PHB depolymerase family esterase [Ornithinimicrobium sp. F0845]
MSDALNCWSSDDPRQQQRGAREPALLAGVARQVVREYDADPDQVHVVGASSGAGGAVILAATYPDIFATASSVAGGEYGLNQVDPDHPGATPPDYTARQAWSQMGERARHVPLLIIQGDEDAIVPPLVGTRLAEQWAAVSDQVDDGLLNDSLDLVEESRSRHRWAPPAVHLSTSDPFAAWVLCNPLSRHDRAGTSGELVVGELYEQIAQRRRELGLRQVDLAELAGVSERFVRLLESGEASDTGLELDVRRLQRRVQLRIGSSTVRR